LKSYQPTIAELTLPPVQFTPTADPCREVATLLAVALAMFEVPQPLLPMAVKIRNVVPTRRYDVDIADQSFGFELGSGPFSCLVNAVPDVP
jgi:hypothetical protein